MKKISLYLVAHLFFFVLVSTATASGIRADSFTLSGIVGGYSFDGLQHLETNPVIGIRGGYNFTKYFGVEALFDYVSTKSTRTGLGDASLYRYGGDLLLHLFPENRLVPYLAAGYSGLSYDMDNQKNYTKGAFDYGPGIKYFLTDNLALRGDFRHLIFRHNDTIFNYEYTAGLTYQFGGMKPALKPVAELVEPLEPVAAAEPTPDRMKYCLSLKIEYDIDVRRKLFLLFEKGCESLREITYRSGIDIEKTDSYSV